VRQHATLFSSLDAEGRLKALEKCSALSSELMPGYDYSREIRLTPGSTAIGRAQAEARDEPSCEPGPPDRAEAGWISWRVHRALEELSEPERQVIALAYWSGLAQSEVAEFLGIPLGTVKTRTRAALSHLADLLDGELG